MCWTPTGMLGPLPTGSAMPLATPTLRSPARCATWAKPILGWYLRAAGQHWLRTRTDARHWRLSRRYFRLFCPPRDWPSSAERNLQQNLRYHVGTLRESRRDSHKCSDIRRRPEVSILGGGFRTKSLRQRVEIAQRLQRDSEFRGRWSQAAEGVRKPGISSEVRTAADNKLTHQFRHTQPRLHIRVQ